MAIKTNLIPTVHFNISKDGNTAQLNTFGRNYLIRKLFPNKEDQDEIKKIGENNFEQTELVKGYFEQVHNFLNDFLQHPLHREMLLGAAEGTDPKFQGTEVAITFPTIPADQDTSILPTYVFNAVEHFTIDSQTRKASLTENAKELILTQLYGDKETREVMLNAYRPKVEIDKITQNFENKINETLTGDSEYADLVLEMQSGTLNPKLKRFVPPVRIKFAIKG